jgi:hypothetical protein
MDEVEMSILVFKNETALQFDDCILAYAYCQCDWL